MFDGVHAPQVTVSLALGGSASASPSGGSLVLDVGPPLDSGTLSGGVWTDIPAGLVTSITIRQGQDGEHEPVTPGVCTIVLDNTDGDYDPDNINLVTNGDFERDLVGWSAYGSTPPTLTREQAPLAGVWAMRVAWPTASGLLGPQYVVSDLEPGAEYTYSAWVRVGSGPAVACLIAGVGFGGSTGTAVGIYVPISQTFTATAATHTIQLAPVSATTAGQYCQVDQVIMQVGRRAHAPSPIAASLNIGKPIRVVATFGAQSSPRFAGFIEDIQPNIGKNPTVTLVCKDGLGLLGRHKLSEIPGSFDGDRTGTRIARLLAEGGWPAELRTIATGRAVCQPATYGDYVLPLIEEVVTTELGAAYVDTLGRFRFYDRDHVYTDPRCTTVQAHFTDLDDGIEMLDPTVRRTGRQIYNQARITRDGGVEQVADDDPSQLATGVRSFTGQIGKLLRTDAESLDMARWIVARYRTAATHIDQVRVQGLTAGAWPQLLALRPLDRIRARRDYGPATVDVQSLIENYEEVISQDAWDFTFSTRPLGRLRPFTLDASALGGTDLLTLGTPNDTGAGDWLPGAEPPTDPTSDLLMVDTITYDDIGTEANAVAYTGSWVLSALGANHYYSGTVGNSYTIRWYGRRLDVYGVMASTFGVVSVATDGAAPVEFDAGVAALYTDALYASTPLLDLAQHVTVVTIVDATTTGGHGTGFQRAEVWADGPIDGPTEPDGPTTGTLVKVATISDTTIGTTAGGNVVAYAGGTWTRYAADAFTYATVPGATYTIRWHGRRLDIYGKVEPPGGIVSVATDGGAPTTFDTKASPYRLNVLYHRTAELADADHTTIVTITNTTTSGTNVASFMYADVWRWTSDLPDAPDEPPPTTDPGSGGLPAAPAGFWHYGVTRPGSGQYTQANIGQWAAMVGRRVTMPLTYSVRSGTWENIVGPNNYTTANWTDKNVIAVVAHPFTPNSLGSSPNGNQARAILTGNYDAQWARWGTHLAAREAAGFAPVITELAWEFNGSWMNHSAVNADEFVRAFRKVVTAIRSTHRRALIGWTVNAGYSQNPPSHDARTCWPGDEYVDFIGVDLYDHFPRAVGYAAVDAREKNNTGRAYYWYNFAKARGKKLFYPEWGLNNSTDDQASGGGDNPAYIQWMNDWFKKLRGENMLAGEIYFNDVDHENVWSDIYGTGRNPNSRQMYLNLWRP